MAKFKKYLIAITLIIVIAVLYIILKPINSIEGDWVTKNGDLYCTFNEGKVIYLGTTVGSYEKTDQYSWTMYMPTFRM